MLASFRPLDSTQPPLFQCLFLFLALIACQDNSAPPPTEESHEVDYAAVQERVRQREDAVLEAFLQEQGDHLPSTAEEIISRHLLAVGGREAFDTIQTMVLHFTAHSSAGTVEELVRYHKKPNHYRQQNEGSTRASVTDGESFWWVGPEGWEAAHEEAAGYGALISMDNHLVDPGAFGITHELIGASVLDMDPGFEVRRIWPDGSEQVLYFSAVSGLLTAVRSSYALMAESWFSFWDYRELGGVRIPFVHIRSVGEFGPPHGLVLQSVEINVPLPDSLFLPPELR